jgi:hypothetical protein|tara:strand:+ start:2250 stop:2366 length:117 start_codon:yes stop_codon:yes gene_type:complete
MSEAVFLTPASPRKAKTLTDPYFSIREVILCESFLGME